MVAGSCGAESGEGRHGLPRRSWDFGTHMILETVPVPPSIPQNAHQVLNRTPRHYAGTLRAHTDSGGGKRESPVPAQIVIKPGSWSTYGP
jgi:hypothetical protein